MDLKNKNILLISPEPWDHIFVSKHHYAIRLAKRGNRVFFLNPPISRINVEITEFENVVSVKYKGFIKGLRFLPAFLQKNLIKKVFSELEAICEVKFDIVWSFDNSVFFDFSALPEYVLKISHIVDLNQNFQLKVAASTADICFAVSENILNRLKSYNPNAFFINHGYNFIVGIKGGKHLPGCNFRKVVYSGNLSMLYLDWELLNNIVEKNQEVDFIFIGPGMRDFSPRLRNMHKFKMKCLNNKNAYKIGKVNSEELIEWYRSADALFIAYQEEYHIEQSNSHKMMEYLGSGKMIVATKTEEYLPLVNDGLFLMSKQNNELPQIFEAAIQEIDKWNSVEKQTARQAFAMENTYEKQIDRIENYIANGKFS